MKYLRFTMILAVMAFFASCSSEDDPTPGTPAEMIVGTWNITSSELLGISVPGLSSKLTFNACGETECTGSDYQSADESTGEFTYTLSSDGKTLTIVDEQEEGGAYNGTWTVVSLDGNTLDIKSSTILGEFKIFMSK